MPYDGVTTENRAVLPDGWRGSTALNNTVQAYADLSYKVKALLGFPITDLEVSDEQVAIYIDDAIEWYTTYAGQERKVLVFCDKHYKPGLGVKLDDVVTRTAYASSEGFTNTTVQVITSTSIEANHISTESAYLSVTPFTYPANLGSDPDITVRPTTGQKVYFKFDSASPWDLSDVCDANAVQIYPTGSEWWELSTVFDEISVGTIEDDFGFEWSDLDPISAYSPDYVVPTSATPSWMLSSIPAEYFDTSLFYSDPTLVYFPVSGCINIKDGAGVVYPQCNKGLVGCEDTQWVIEPSFTYVPIDENDIPYLFLDSELNIVTETDAPYLSSPSEGVISNDNAYITSLSGVNGAIIDPDNLNLQSATHITVPGIPTCAVDSTIPLRTNEGYYSTFTLCNSSINTMGPYPVRNIQFQKDNRLSSDLLGSIHGNIEQNGFLVTRCITAHGDCFKHTPEWIKVDLRFQNREKICNIGTGCVSFSGGTDYDLNLRRKVSAVWSLDADSGSGGGMYGSNILFSFDHGMVGQTFGFDMMGNRNFARNGYDMLTYELARGFIDRIRRMVNYHSYEFNPESQYLKIIPEPNVRAQGSIFKGTRCYALGIYLEKPIVELINNKWIQDFTKAKVMQSLGYIRSKFGQVTLFGGASINGDSLVTMGNELEDKLLEELKAGGTWSDPPQFFVG